MKESYWAEVARMKRYEAELVHIESGWWMHPETGAFTWREPK